MHVHCRGRMVVCCFTLWIACIIPVKLTLSLCNTLSASLSIFFLPLSEPLPSSLVTTMHLSSPSLCNEVEVIAIDSHYVVYWYSVTPWKVTSYQLCICLKIRNHYWNPHCLWNERQRSVPQSKDTENSEYMYKEWIKKKIHLWWSFPLDRKCLLTCLTSNALWT